MNDLLKILDKKQNELVGFAQSLVRIDSCGGNETEVCKVIQKKLNQYGIKSKLSGFTRQRMNLECKIRGKGEKTLLLCGHTDTVPVGDLSKWKYPPFSGKLVNGKIYGRGAWDMKGGDAGLVFSLIALKEAKIPLGGDISLLLVANEEAVKEGKKQGIKYALRKGIKAEACILGEPRPNISIGSRGAFRLEIKTLGKSAHTGRLHAKGINAVTKMAKVILALEKMKMRYRPHKLFPPPKITPGTIISGGHSVNIYPDICCALIDIRLSLGQTKESVRKNIGKIIDKLQKQDKELKVKIKEIGYVPPAIVNPKHKLVKILDRNIRKILKIKPEIKVGGATSDGNFLSVKGIPTILFGPEGKNLHSENEFVYTKSLLEVARVYALTICDFLK